MSRRRVVAVLLAGLALAGGVLSGCGKHDDGSYGATGVDPRFKEYCQEVSDQQRAVTEALARSQSSGLLYALPSFERLQAKAPADIADDWTVVVRRISALKSALDDAGIAPEDYDPKTTPKTLDRVHRQAIEQAAADLLAADTAISLQAVQQEARDVCKTSLGFS